MKNIVDVFKERLPKELILKDVKELKFQYNVIVEYNGIIKKIKLSKMITAGCDNEVVDYAINNTMASIMMELGNYQEAKEWLDKIMNK